MLTFHFSHSLGSSADGKESTIHAVLPLTVLVSTDVRLFHHTTARGRFPVADQVEPGQISLRLHSILSVRRPADGPLL